MRAQATQRRDSEVKGIQSLRAVSNDPDWHLITPSNEERLNQYRSAKRFNEMAGYTPDLKVIKA